MIIDSIDNIDAIAAIDTIALILLSFGTGMLIGAVLYIINRIINSVRRGY